MSGGVSDRPDGAPPRRLPPRATLRLQLSSAFGFDEVWRHIPYFKELGISHLYLSPIFQARAGSTHGYDVVDHNRLNPELGGDSAFERMAEAAHLAGLGLILDFVPNHVGVGGADNPAWLSVLEWGAASPMADHFDIDWEALSPHLHGKLLVPTLGDHYGRVLENGDLALALDAGEGTISLWYYEHRFPIHPRDYGGLLERAAASLPRTGLADLARDFAALPRPIRRDAQADETVARAAELKRRLAALLEEHAQAAAAIEAVLTLLNGTPGDPRSFADLDALIDAQTYRPAFWRVASDEINYRRFFDINDLAGIRVEEPAVFEATHRLLLDLMARGIVDGVRLDHTDGLYDPAGYFARLQDAATARLSEVNRLAPADAEACGGPLYLLAEKILGPYETLPEDWRIAGTTGYDFLADLQGLFIAPDAEKPVRSFFRRFSGRAASFEEEVVAAKHQILRQNLASELTVLAGDMHALAQQSWLTRDFTFNTLRYALMEVLAHFPVYRTYVSAAGVSGEDRRHIDLAFARARKAAPVFDRSVFDYLYAVMTTDLAAGDGGPYDADEIIRIAMKAQQLTGPVTAKSVEDTVFYRHVPLAPLNEVGAEPSRFHVAPAEFHQAMRRRADSAPFAMLGTATHDTKRGEDVRARLCVLSEMPEDWARAVVRWARTNAPKRYFVQGQPAPVRRDEYLLYQTLVGAWPFHLSVHDGEGLAAFAERIEAYMVKAMREAKEQTGWAAPNGDYEDAVTDFVGRLLDPAQSEPFLADIAAFVARMEPAGAVNGLAQTVVKLTAPGIPDIYQGTEFWDLSLVDPDNRRPVDFEARQAVLQRILKPGFGADDIAALRRDWRDGAVKLFVQHRLLELRTRYPGLFARGDYVPLEIEGALSGHVVAFARTADPVTLIAVVPRLVGRHLSADGDLTLDAGALADSRLAVPVEAIALGDVMTGAPLAPSEGAFALSDLLTALPVFVGLATSQR